MGMHAFYSKKQENSSKEIIEKNKKKDERKVRYNVYLNEAGEELIVTEVSKNSERISSHAKNFSDSQYLGIVTEWNRIVYWE